MAYQTTLKEKVSIIPINESEYDYLIIRKLITDSLLKGFLV